MATRVTRESDMRDLGEGVASNHQQLTTTMSDGSALLIMTGVLEVYFQVGVNGPAAVDGDETYLVMMGPRFVPGARAIAMVGAASVATPGRGMHSVQAVEADFDDETGRVQLTFEVSARLEADPAATTYRAVRIDGVTYHVTIKGEIAA